MPQSAPDIIAAVVALLEHVRGRPKMYLVPPTAETADAFLRGLFMGLEAAGVDVRTDWWDAQAARGWYKCAVGSVPQMRERGLNEAEIVTELIDISLAQLQLVGSAGTPADHSLG